MKRSNLIGYARKSRISPNVIVLNISEDTFRMAERYTATDGNEFVQLVISSQKMRALIAGQKEVTSICQVIEVPKPVEHVSKTYTKQEFMDLIAEFEACPHCGSRNIEGHMCNDCHQRFTQPEDTEWLMIWLEKELED